MAMVTRPRDAHHMAHRSPQIDDEASLQAGGHQLQQAAGTVLKHAPAGESTQALAVTLAHIEEALDRLSVGMLQLAHVVATSRESGADRGILSPEAQALCFHLREVSDGLQDPQDSLRLSRLWLRVLRDGEATQDDAEATAEAFR